MPVPSRRQALQTLLDPLEARTWRPDHAGLWLDRYGAGQLARNESPGKAATPQQRLVREVHAIAPSAIYARFFERWQRQLASMKVQLDDSDYRVQVRRATTTGRIAVGLGDASVIETAVRLHQTYGVPYLPGSALKGLASAYAHQYLADDGWRKGGRYHQILFGTTTAAGYITFFDALYEPGSGLEGRPLWPDVITVHHKGYYEGQAHTPPADWDSPTPIAFLSATGTYLLALGGPPGWVEKAFEILALALAELGIGAKTSSGYGRLQVEDQTAAQGQQAAAAAAPAQPTATPAQQALARFLQRVARARAGELPNEMGPWRQLDPSIRRAAAQQLIARAEELFGARVAERAWFDELHAFVEQNP